MRKLVILMFVGLLGPLVPATAHAEVGIGLFAGEPTGFDLKIDIARSSAIDVLLGWTSFRENRGGYGHLTYLVTPLVGQGQAVKVPLRLGIGVALFGTRHDLDVAVRAPLEVALRFRRSPLEIYGEIALAVTFPDPDQDARLDIQGGIGLRVFF